MGNAHGMNVNLQEDKGRNSGTAVVAAAAAASGSGGVVAAVFVSVVAAAFFMYAYGMGPMGDYSRMATHSASTVPVAMPRTSKSCSG